MELLTIVFTSFPIIAIFAVIALLLPYFMRALGFHPDYDGEKFDFNGKKALIVTTSHNTLNKPGETKGKKTGVASSELTVPYYEFLDNGVEVDLASIKGGEIPIDPQTMLYFIKSKLDKRFHKDGNALEKLKNSQCIDDVDFTNYDLILVAGGWGAAYDLGYSETLGSKISEAYHARSIIGGVCHGPLGFINAKDKDGKLLIAGRKMTAVTNKQVKELGISMTPQHPETELKKAGVIFDSKSKLIDVFANLTVVDDEERFVTGQNQNAGHETAQKMMSILASREIN